MVKDILAENEKIEPNDKEMTILRETFPTCFHDNNFDIERFKEFLKDKINITSDGYELKFLGKNYARLLASLDTTTVIVPDEEHNSKPENINSKNIYISGDNLDGLKHLLKSYYHKVKCIYIDPPYNTGTDDFVYNDNFHFTVQDLTTKLSIEEEHAKRILDLTKRGSASHSAWLMFMYPRLILARDLLTDDGVIFISIDDNEQANLKLLCDDVFGEENFVTAFPRVTKKGGKSSEATAKNHDYLFCYLKDINNSSLQGISHNDDGYCNKDEYFDERGYYKLNQTLDYDSLGYVKTLDYPIEIEGKFFYAGGEKSDYEKRQNGMHGRADWGWRWSKDLFGFGYNNGFIVVKKGGSRDRIYTKTYQNVKIIKAENGKYVIKKIDRTKPLSTLQFTDNQFSNDNATKTITELLGKGIFEYTKPPILIEQLLELLSNEGDNSPLIILDFFSGSGTTAQSVMQFNLKNDTHFQFIVVQIDEPTKKDGEAERAGYKTIDAIGRDRIKKAADKIKLEYPNTEADLGFKHYTLAEPESTILEELERFNPDDKTILANNGILSEFGEATVLSTWLIKDGYGFTPELHELDFEGYKAWHSGKHLYLINAGITQKAISSIVSKIETDGSFNPENIVIFGYSFAWTELEDLKINLMKLQDTEKHLKVNFDVRY